MANQNIKLNIIELQAALSSLKASIQEFDSYTKNFRSSTRGQLKSFNSDFVEEMDALLDNINDDSNTKLLENLHAIHQAGEILVTKMKETDEKIGQVIRSGSK